MGEVAKVGGPQDNLRADEELCCGGREIPQGILADIIEVDHLGATTASRLDT